MRVLTGILLAALAVAAGAARGADASSCEGVSLEAYGTVPQLFVDDRPDSLAGLLIRWDATCGPLEVIERTRILAAIWDDAFDESLYDPDIIDDLAAYGPAVTPEPDPDATDPRERYDAFTRSLADQLLPHTDQGSLQAFFCLFYSGRTTEAWAMLRSDDLADTELARLYANEQEILAVPQPSLVVAATGGGWYPDGDVGFVGNKPEFGVLVGLRGHDWLGRVVLEMRIGRADRPYQVVEAGAPRWSDRFDAALLGVELGRIVNLGDHVKFDMFGGLGADAVTPFKSEDLMLTSFHTSLGAGLRMLVGPRRKWLVGIDGRREWLTERNGLGTPLGGAAWSLRLVLGIHLDSGREARRRALNP